MKKDQLDYQNNMKRNDGNIEDMLYSDNWKTSANNDASQGGNDGTDSRPMTSSDRMYVHICFLVSLIELLPHKMRVSLNFVVGILLDCSFDYLIRSLYGNKILI